MKNWKNILLNNLVRFGSEITGLKREKKGFCNEEAKDKTLFCDSDNTSCGLCITEYLSGKCQNFTG